MRFFCTFLIHRNYTDGKDNQSYIQNSHSHYLIQWFTQFKVTLAMGFSSFLLHDAANTKFLFVLRGRSKSHGSFAKALCQLFLLGSYP